jgi:threonine dehydrogenase-like Zn-dependent dehydrogenase
MHAVMNTDDGIRVVDADEPDGAGVRLSIASAGICGTDVSLVAADINGFIYGHEFAGVYPQSTVEIIGVVRADMVSCLACLALP